MEKGIKFLLAAFITIILGVVLLSVYSDTNYSKTTQSAATETFNIASARLALGEINESKVFTVANPRTGWKAQSSDCGESILSMTNGTATASATNYTFNADGTFTLKNGTFWVTRTAGGNTSVVTYKYCGNEYLDVGWGRSIANISVGLFAVLCLAAAVAFLYMAFKEMGIGLK